MGDKEHEEMGTDLSTVHVHVKHRKFLRIHIRSPMDADRDT